MRNLILSLTLLCCVVYNTSAQKKNVEAIEKAIVDEATALYNSEWASWYGTDVFLAKCADKKPQGGGYLSYDDGKGMVNIFFSKDSIPKIIATISFGYEFDENKYQLDTVKRDLNKQEKELYTLRKAAMQRMNNDTTFKYYKNTSLNPVPFIYKGQKKVYVLTGTNTNGVVIFGNDYRIDFDKKDKITQVTKLHNSIIPIENPGKNVTDSSKIIVASFHNHVKGKDEFITVTDLCTIMLYAHLTTWKTCYVMSNTYVSIWDVNQKKLAIITREAWDKISNDQKAGQILGKGK
ncbi:hypothetical protein IM792_14585 [Mucilaginibacter sp. JRF]|uniref:hypothetical protein n=1 Tax=Mucilaginibacter sp. JRF TaxID=2780088 RepID=UPI00188079D2|nr:hypothetical protein [Mucilaginibacter sp. JRF]MBE9585681.1 hypothetical protein [Mucilaginibacter sp. JRF]